MRRIRLSVISAVVLTMALAGTALGHHVISIDCGEEGVAVQANIGDNHKLIVTINGTEVMNEAVPGAVIDRTFNLPWSDWPAEVEVEIQFPDGEHEDSKDKTLNCGEPDIDVEKMNDTEGPVELGTEVTYTVTVTNDGDFDLTVVDVDDLLISGPGPVCDLERDTAHALAVGNDDDILETGETWVYTCSTDELGVGETVNEACVEAELYHGDLRLQTAVVEDEISDCDQSSVIVVEGGTGGETGTPEGGSIPDTATSLPSQSSPVATLLFGVLLVSSLGALAYANVRSGRR